MYNYSVDVWILFTIRHIFSRLIAAEIGEGEELDTWVRVSLRNQGLTNKEIIADIIWSGVR